MSSFFKKEYEDIHFLDKIPIASEEEKDLYNFRINLLKKYEKIKKISENLKIIKENEEMDDELKRNDNEMLNLIKNKDIYQKEYDDSLKKCIDDINAYKKDDNEKNKIFNNKLDFLITQVKNDLYNIKYYGYVNEEKNESEESSSSSSEENEKE